MAIVRPVVRVDGLCCIPQPLADYGLGLKHADSNAQGSKQIVWKCLLKLSLYAFYQGLPGSM